jgi:hypothetical protein
MVKFYQPAGSEATEHPEDSVRSAEMLCHKHSDSAGAPSGGSRPNRASNLAARSVKYTVL